MKALNDVQKKAGDGKSLLEWKLEALNVRDPILKKMKLKYPISSLAQRWIVEKMIIRKLVRKSLAQKWVFS